MNTAIKKTGFGILLGILLIVGVQFASAWTPPTAAPTGGNAAAPVNTSTFPQIKPGMLGLQELTVMMNAHLSYLANPTTEHLCADASGFLVLCPATPGVVTPPVVPPVSGYCGTADGMPSQNAPTTNLCDSGTATTVTGSGPWIWSCNGSDGGTSSSCSAPTGYELTVTKDDTNCTLGSVTTSWTPLVWTNGTNNQGQPVLIGKATFPSGTPVALVGQAGTCPIDNIPNNNNGWIGATTPLPGCPNGYDGYCAMTMTGPKSVSWVGSSAPVYDLIVYKPNIDSNNGNAPWSTSAGSVAAVANPSNGSFVWNGANRYNGLYNNSTAVTLTAQNQGGAQFQAWTYSSDGTLTNDTNICVGSETNPVCVTNMLADKTVYAWFING